MKRPVLYFRCSPKEWAARVLKSASNLSDSVRFQSSERNEESEAWKYSDKNQIHHFVPFCKIDFYISQRCYLLVMIIVLLENEIKSELLNGENKQLHWKIVILNKLALFCKYLRSEILDLYEIVQLSID